MVASLATAELKRTAAGHPDLTGTYDSGTLTPQERPEVFGDKQFMSREEADRLLKAHIHSRKPTRTKLATLTEVRRKRVAMVNKPMGLVALVATTRFGSSLAVGSLGSMARSEPLLFTIHLMVAVHP